MSKNVEVLLLENVYNLGIVGDVVSVRSGYARNYLLPRELATAPSQEMIDQLAEKRAEAEREVARLRSERETLTAKLEGVEITLERSCNDQGQLYGSVTQQDIADKLTEEGYPIEPRAVRLGHTIKRIDSYEVAVKPESDLEAMIKVWVVADRKLAAEEDEREEMEFDNEGNLIERPSRPARARADDESAEAEGSEGGAEGGSEAEEPASA